VLVNKWEAAVLLAAGMSFEQRSVPVVLSVPFLSDVEQQAKSTRQISPNGFADAIGY
jgi:hypothetical protein